jgi:DnaJ-class molecular chaperone
VETFTDNIERAHRKLGLTVFASPSEIKKAWRRCARETHPDHGGNGAAFEEVQVAAKTLLAMGVRESYQAEIQRRETMKGSASNSAAPNSGEVIHTQTKTRRYKSLLLAAIFGGLIATHVHQNGVAEYPLELFCFLMHSTYWIFFLAWLGIKKRAIKSSN